MRWERRQRRLAVLLLLLIPLGIPAGLFAPNFIALTTAEDPSPAVDLSTDAPRVELDHEPPRYTRYFSEGAAPPPTHASRLASLLRPAPPPDEPDPPEPLQRTVTFPSYDSLPESGDSDEGEPGDPTEAFDVPDLPEDEFDDSWPPEFFIAELPSGSSFTQPPPVPEPGTGALLGAGLVALAVQRRSNRRRGIRELRSGR